MLKMVRRINCNNFRVIECLLAGFFLSAKFCSRKYAYIRALEMEAKKIRIYHSELIQIANERQQFSLRLPSLLLRQCFSTEHD